MPLEKCSSCSPVITCCSGGNLFTYSLTDGTLISNEQTGFVFSCPPGFVCAPGQYPLSVIIPPNAVKMTVPEAVPGLSPLPLTLACAGGTITRSIPPGSTQQQIIALAQQMVKQCVQQMAQIQAIPPHTSPIQFFNSPDCITICSDPTKKISGPVPPPFTNTDSQLCVPGGVFQSTVSQDDANTIAEVELATIALGLTCVPKATCSPMPTQQLNFSVGTFSTQPTNLSFRSQGTPICFTDDGVSENLYGINLNTQAVSVVASAYDLTGWSAYCAATDTFIIIDGNTDEFVQVDATTLTEVNSLAQTAPGTFFSVDPVTNLLYAESGQQIIVVNLSTNTQVGFWDSGDSNLVPEGPFYFDTANKVLYGSLFNVSGDTSELLLLDITANNPTLIGTFAAPTGVNQQLVPTVFVPDNNTVYCFYNNIGGSNPMFTRFNTVSRTFSNNQSITTTGRSADVYDPTSKLIFLSYSNIAANLRQFQVYCPQPNSMIPGSVDTFVGTITYSTQLNAAVFSGSKGVASVTGSFAQNLITYA